jgi:hypothetical protein
VASPSLRSCRHGCNPKKAAAPSRSHITAETPAALASAPAPVRSSVATPLRAAMASVEASAQPGDEDMSSYLTSLPVLALASVCGSEEEFTGRFPEQLQAWASGVWRRCSEFQHVQEKLQEVRDQGQQPKYQQRRWR